MTSLSIKLNFIYERNVRKFSSSINADFGADTPMLDCANAVCSFQKFRMF